MTRTVCADLRGRVGAGPSGRLVTAQSLLAVSRVLLVGPVHTGYPRQPRAGALLARDGVIAALEARA